jgi:hypothetical protein
MGATRIELAIMDVGGLLTILCLLLPIGPAGKIVLCGVVLIAGFFLTMVRMQDGMNPLEFFWRRYKKNKIG